MDDTDLRVVALSQAALLHKEIFPEEAAGSSLAGAARRVLSTATIFLTWLEKPSFIKIVVGAIIDQKSKKPTGTIYGGQGVMQLHDNEQVDLTVTETDAKGVSLQDTLTWTSDDTAGTIVTLKVSTDTQTCTVVAGTPGSAVVTVTDGTLSATLAVDVIPGAATAITITPGTPVVQPAA
jgi:hypothetical protein